MKKQINEKKQIRTFGFGLTGFLSLIGGLHIYKGHPESSIYFFGASFVALCISIIVPTALKHIYKIMMLIAHAIGWVNTHILLGLIFYLIISPVGLFLKAIRKDLLNRKIDKSCNTYWNRREKTEMDKSRYERQF